MPNAPTCITLPHAMIPGRSTRTANPAPQVVAQEPTVTIRTAALSLLIVCLAACGRSPEAPEAALEEDKSSQAAPPSAARPAASTDAERDPPAPLPAELNARDATEVDAEIVQVRLSDYGDMEKKVVGSAVSHFAPTDTVYAEVESAGTADAYTIYAKWISNEGDVLADYGVRVDQPGSQRTIISLSKPDGWSSGKNTIELAINGEHEQTVTFQVQ
ncbi:hypothetical protein AB6713_12335 [Luteimonas sp. B3_2_R+30]|uniref:Lipoprotein n=2 Tax=Luteimonas salinilitoris TaxID=3237697 RepID=A0ABV4HRK8_9GAMM